MATHIKLVDNNNKNVSLAAMQRHRLNDQERRQLQHEFKIYMENTSRISWAKGSIRPKSSFGTICWLSGRGFLTEPEKYINNTPSGREVVRAARMQVVKQHAIDNVGYFEQRLGATAIHHAYELEPEK